MRATSARIEGWREALYVRRFLPILLFIPIAFTIALTIFQVTDVFSRTGTRDIYAQIAIGLLALLALTLVRPAAPLFLLLVFLCSPFQFMVDPVTSAVITSTLLTCGLLGVVVFLARRKRIESNPLLLAMLLFGAYAVVSAVLGFRAGNELKYILGDLFQVVEFVLVFVLVSVLTQDSRTSHQLIKLSSLSILVTIVWEFYLFMRGQAADEAYWYYGGTGGLGEGLPRTINFASLVLLPPLLCLATYFKSGRQRLIYLFLFILVALNLILSFTRGLWLASLVSILVVVWLAGAGERKRVAGLLLTLGIAGTLAVASLNIVSGGQKWSFADLLVQRYKYTFVEFEDWQSGRGYEVRRLGEFVGVSGEIRRAPFLGNGLGATYVVSEVSLLGTPVITREHFIHNFYLGTMLRMGAVGLLSFLVILFVYFREGRRIANSLTPGRAKALVVGFIGSIAGMALVSMTSPTLINHPTAVFSACAMALTFQLPRSASPQPQPGSSSPAASVLRKLNGTSR